MTARWEKGDSHLVLILEGVKSTFNDLKQALDINIEGNIIIDATQLEDWNSSCVDFLNEFGTSHKAKHFSVILVYPKKIKGLRQIEIIPTLPEARDMIFMEIAERELGFFGLDEE